MRYPVTPDGRYFVAKGVLWRRTDPSLSEEKRQRLVRELMAARRAVRDARDDEETRTARASVHAAKTALGERGEPWWGSGETYDRMTPTNTPYAEWWRKVQAEG